MQKEGFNLIQEKIARRQSANLEIINLLSKIVNENPELRFCQILTILELDRDKFYEESTDTLHHIKKLIVSRNF